MQKSRLLQHFNLLDRAKIHIIFTFTCEKKDLFQNFQNQAGDAGVPSATEELFVWLTATEIYLRFLSALPNHVTPPKPWCDSPHPVDNPYLKQMLSLKDVLRPMSGKVIEETLHKQDDKRFLLKSTVRFLALSQIFFFTRMLASYICNILRCVKTWEKMRT